jgi:hypothetical protein
MCWTGSPLVTPFAPGWPHPNDFTVNEAPSGEERQQSLDNCIDLLKGVPVGLKD